MSQPLWMQSLRTVPQVSADQWQQIGGMTRWLVASRASVLIMTLTSTMVGGLLALRQGEFDALPWLVCAIGLLLAHATNNQLNDFTDSRRGIDKNNYFRNQYGTHVLENGLLSPAQLLRYIALTGAMAIACGLWLVYLRGDMALWLMLSGAFFVLFYTWPLKYIGLGEPAVLLVWGPLMVGGSYFIASGEWSWPACWVGLLYGLGPTTVLFGKHIDKLEADKAKGVYSLPVLLGKPLARKTAMLLLLSQYPLAVYIVWQGYLGYSLALMLLAIPALIKVLKVFAAPTPAEMPAGFRREVWPLWYAPNAFQYNRHAGGLLLLALLLAIWI